MHFNKKGVIIMLKIHVVDSVKGGCGKSTYCLLLADYINKKGRKPYIIDLDIHGTSWYKDKRRYYEEKGERFRFINDLVQDKSNLSGNYIMHLRIARDIDGVKCEEYKIPICVADPSRANSIQEEQLDIFEYTVATIIEHIFFNERKKDDNAYDIDIILDMPPGYEPHAEKIINHMLFDINSPLVQCFKIRDAEKKREASTQIDELKKESRFDERRPEIDQKVKQIASNTEFEVFFYMISGFSRSGVELNAEYIINLFHGKTYSSQIDRLLPYKNIYFVFNDLGDIFVHYGRETFDSTSSNLAASLRSVFFNKRFFKDFRTKELVYLDNISGLIINDNNKMYNKRGFFVLSKKATDAFSQTVSYFFS